MESRDREIGSARSAEATFQKQLFAEEKKSLSFEAATKEAQVSLEESRNKVKGLTWEVEKLQKELAETKAIPPPPPSPPKAIAEDSGAVVALRADVARLESEKEELVRRFNNIEERYKRDDLVRPQPSRPM